MAVIKSCVTFSDCGSPSTGFTYLEKPGSFFLICISRGYLTKCQKPASFFKQHNSRGGREHFVFLKSLPAFFSLMGICQV
jgi:hypothetical protein